MLSSATIALALAIAADAPAANTIRLPMVLTVERVPLPPQAMGATLVVEAYAGTVELRVDQPAEVKRRILPSLGPLCPQAFVAGGSVVLRCRTRRIDARLMDQGGKRFLELYELRGLPWRGETQELKMFYDPSVVGFGERCPGVRPVARGECLLGQGKPWEAAVQLRLALTSADQSFASMRLGDIAVGTGEIEKALAWYKRAGTNDRWGRMARSRLCELGGCPEGVTDKVYDPRLHPELVRAELTLRVARVAAFEDRLADVVTNLRQLIPDRHRTGVCVKFGREMCRRLLLFVLEHPSEEAASEAMEVYLDVPERDRGPYSRDLVRAAADKAALIGAPVFGGNLLAASVPWEGATELPDHLLRAAELYLLGHDKPRARVVYEYADSRIGQKLMVGRRWGAIRGEVGRIDADDRPVIGPHDMLELESLKDMAAAITAVARSRRVSW